MTYQRKLMYRDKLTYMLKMKILRVRHLHMKAPTRRRMPRRTRRTNPSHAKDPGRTKDPSHAKDPGRTKDPGHTGKDHQVPADPPGRGQADPPDHVAAEEDPDQGQENLITSHAKAPGRTKDPSHAKDPGRTKDPGRADQDHAEGSRVL